MRHETILEPTFLAALQRVLERLELLPEREAATWFHPSTDGDACAVDFEVHDVARDVRVALHRDGESPGGFKVARSIRLTVDGEFERAAAGLMQEILSALGEERRLECAGAEHFLGNPDDFGWTTEIYPKALLPTVHETIERELSEWRRIKVARAHNTRSIQREPMLDSAGKRVSVYTAGRFFYRNERSWLVLEIEPAGAAATKVLVAAAGVEEGWETSFLKRIEDACGHHALTSRRMTADGEELELDKRYGWDDLFVDEQTKAALIEETVAFFERRELYEKMKIPFRRGLLLHGAPGTGKTLVGRILASTLENTLFVWVTAATASNGEQIAQIFELSRHAARTVLFFEDLDLYASHRHDYRHTDTLGELLVQLDGMRTNDGLLVVATTNDLEAIEPALRDRPSRFDRLIELTPAPEDVRRAHLARLFADLEVPRELDALGSRTDGFTGAQLQELAVRARMAAAQRGDTRISAADLAAARDAAEQFRAAPIGF